MALSRINQRTDVAGGESVGGNRLVDRLGDLRLRVGQIAKADNERGIEQAVDMFFKAEHGRAAIGRVAADPFEHAEPILQAGTHERNDPSADGRSSPSIHMYCGVPGMSSPQW